VLRHGDEPEVLEFSSRAEQAAHIARLALDWREKGMASIAVIGRGEARLRELLKLLPPALGARLLSAEDSSGLSGLLLTPAGAVKGLEFDAVILADAGAESFPDDPREARLLYVCLTRALHRLAILHRGPLTPLLAGR